MEKGLRQLLENYLDGTSTPQELEKIRQLLERPETEKTLHVLMKERAARYEAAISDEALKEKVKAWEEQVLRRIEASAKNAEFVPGDPPAPSTTATAETSPAPPRRTVWLRGAAVWAALFVLGASAVWQYKKMTLPGRGAVVFVERLNEAAFPESYLLPDSSRVYLGAGGKLRYPSGFSRNMREVSLWGEAFFEVRPERERPFVVQTRSMQTRVLGTSFKVEAFEGRPQTVAVATGKVSVSANGAKKDLATLTPGLKLSYDEATGTHRQTEADVGGLLQWAAGDLVFDEQPLEAVMKELEKRYGISFRFDDPETADYKVSGSFEKGTEIERILTMLGIIAKFRYTFENNHSVNIFK